MVPHRKDLFEQLFRRLEAPGCPTNSFDVHRVHPSPATPAAASS
jgi:hypothetical protein